MCPGKPASDLTQKIKSPWKYYFTHWKTHWSYCVWSAELTQGWNKARKTPPWWLCVWAHSYQARLRDPPLQSVMLPVRGSLSSSGPQTVRKGSACSSPESKTLWYLWEALPTGRIICPAGDRACAVSLEQGQQYILPCVHQPGSTVALAFRSSSPRWVLNDRLQTRVLLVKWKIQILLCFALLVSSPSPSAVWQDTESQVLLDNQWHDLHFHGTFHTNGCQRTLQTISL